MDVPGPVSRTSGEPEKQEGVDLEDGKCVKAVFASDIILIVLMRGVEQEDAVKEGPMSRMSGEPEKQEGVDLEDGKCVKAVFASDIILIVLMRGVEQEDVVKEEDLLNATVEEKGLVKSRMKAHTRHRPTCRQCEADHGEGQLKYGVDVNPTVCDIV
ncbi:hypothetical protein PF007_g20045 [Phytophthora fragariae]|uniref:Uncharacterized protein n=1 Tax=Phytophthora fragariae TaxID=53985 RepID=A0A6A3R2M9_9STRA|nr:hypothetical protein PF007_g20045 [Phytophthora fragariae]